MRKIRQEGATRNEKVTGSFLNYADNYKAFSGGWSTTLRATSSDGKVVSVLVLPGSHVFVAGTFNNWNPTANPLKDNPDSRHFKAALRVPIGTHEYKFVVNGVWHMDPKCREWVLNGYGSQNSVLHV